MTDTAANPKHARGVLAEASDEHVVLTLPGTDYRLRLRVLKRPATELGKRVRGLVRAEARRIDVVDTGGAYVEPVYGEPRRVQGRIIDVDAANGAITVDAGACPIVCHLDARQRATEFQVGQLVGGAVHSGTTFTPS